MRQWEPIEHKEAYSRWVLPARAWTKGWSLRGGQIKIVFEEGEWLGGAYVSGDEDDGPRFLNPEEIESIRAEFGLDRYIGRSATWSGHSSLSLSMRLGTGSCCAALRQPCEDDTGK